MRTIIAAYGVSYLLLGLWQALAPTSFVAQPFADFPPFNPHYVRDVSSYYLAAGIVLLLIARAADVRQHRQALMLVFLQAAFHTLSHLYDSTIGQGPSWHLYTDTLPILASAALLGWLLWGRGESRGRERAQEGGVAAPRAR
jgi:hypothetical protein